MHMPCGGRTLEKGWGSFPSAPAAVVRYLSCFPDRSADDHQQERLKKVDNLRALQ